VALKIGLLSVLGLLWALRLAAIKAAGVAGIPVHVVVSVSALGIAVFFTGVAVWRRDWPSIDRTTLSFFVLSGFFGFLAPFALESIVAPHLPVFVFVVIISTMPIITLLLSIIVGNERLGAAPVIAIALGFLGAMTILWDTTQTDHEGEFTAVGIWWVMIAFGVPSLYALNTVFVATRWPGTTSAIHVAHAQAMIVSVAAIVGSAFAGAIGDWTLVARDPLAIGLIVAAEGLALLVYLRITRDYGATWVSFANYVAMIFAAIVGAAVFDDRITWLTVAAALVIVASVVLYQRRPATTRTEGAGDV